MYSTKNITAVFLSLLLLMTACQSGSKNEKDTGDKQLSGPELPMPKMPDSIRTANDSANWYMEVGKSLIQTKDYNNAKKSIENAIHLKPMASNYYTALGQLYLEEHFQDSAFKYFSRALHLNTKNKQARLQIAFILWLEDKYQEALLQTDTLLKQAPNLPKAIGVRSQVYEAMGDTVRAISEMKKAIKLQSKSYDAVMRMGDLLLEKQPEKAQSFYLQAMKLDTSKAEPYYCIGLIYEREGNNQRAKNSFNQSIILDAHFLPTYMQLGQVYEKEKNWKKARETYTLATRMAPTKSAPYYRRGRVEEQLENQKAAIADYQQALVFDEENKKAKNALKKIKDEMATETQSKR